MPQGRPIPADARIQRYCQLILRRLGPSADQKETHWTVGVTSCRGGEGVSTIASNLAIAAARQRNGPVLLVDAHLQRPSLHDLFEAPPSPGLAEMLQEATPTCFPHLETAETQLHLTTAGTYQGTRGDLGSRFELFPDCLAAASGEFPMVIVDMPPIDACRESPALLPALLPALSGVLLVAEADRTMRAAVRKAKGTLEHGGVDVLGIVINKQRKRLPSWLGRLLS